MPEEQLPLEELNLREDIADEDSRNIRTNHSKQESQNVQSAMETLLRGQSHLGKRR